MTPADTSGKDIPLPPPRAMGTFLGLIFVAPAVLYLTVRLVALPHTWPQALASWVVLAPFVAGAVHLLTRRLSAAGAGLTWQSRVRRPKVLPWRQIEVLRHEFITAGHDPARVEVEVRAGRSGTLRLELSPDSFHLLRRELFGRCPGMVEVDAEAGHIRTVGGGSTAADRAAKVGRAAAAELPRQWAKVAGAVAVLGALLAAAIATIPSEKAGAARFGAVVVVGLLAAVVVASLADAARTIRRLASQVRWGRRQSWRK